MTLDTLVTVAFIPTISALSGIVVYLWKRQASMTSYIINDRNLRISVLEEHETALNAKIDKLEKRIFELEKEKALLESKFISFVSSYPNIIEKS